MVGPLAVATILSVYLLSQESRYDPALRLFAQLGAVLLVPFLVHAIQLLANVGFDDLSDRWAGLAGWQRGVLGVGVVLLAGGAILWLAFAVALHLAGVGGD